MRRIALYLLAGCFAAAVARGAEKAPFRVLFSNDTTNIVDIELTRGDPVTLSFVDLAVR